jgi:hypothetical protein
MKQTGICPKCQATGVIRIKAFPATSQSNLIMLTKWGSQATYFDRYVCPSCGYIENYIDLNHKTWQKWLEKSSEENTLDSDFV